MPHVYDEDVSYAVQQFVYAAINAERNRIIAAIEEACDSLRVEDDKEWIGDRNGAVPREAYIALNRVRDALKLPPAKKSRKDLPIKGPRKVRRRKS